MCDTNFDDIVVSVNNKVKELVKPHLCEPLKATAQLYNHLNQLKRRYAWDLQGQDDEKALEFAIQHIVSETAAHRLAEIREEQMFSSELHILENPSIEHRNVEHLNPAQHVSGEANRMHAQYLRTLQS